MELRQSAKYAKYIFFKHNFWANHFFFNPHEIKLDEVGPVDNRPFTDKLHHNVKKEKKKKKILHTGDIESLDRCGS